MKQLRACLKNICESDKKYTSKDIDVSSTVVNKAQIDSSVSNNLVTISLFLTKSTVKDQRKDSISDKNSLTLTDIFGHKKVYKFSFVLLKKITDHDKDDISAILRNDTVVSKEDDKESEFVKITIPIIEEYINTSH